MSNRVRESQIHPFLPALLFLGIFVALLVILMPEPQTTIRLPPTATAQPSTAVAVVPTEAATSVPPTPTEAAHTYDAAQVAQGQSLLQASCAACHGLDGRGIPGLGKDLIDSQFVHGLTDDELLQFIIVGRDTSDPLNTTGIPMPPRGGNPALTDEQIRAMIAYMRTEAGSVTQAQAEPTEARVAVAATPSAPLQTPIFPTRIPVTPPPFTADSAYAWSCASCHGADGSGNPPYGESFLSSPLLEDRAALLAFLTDGRPLADPLTEFPHPPRGGYPALTDEQLETLTDYVIQLHGG